MKRAAQLGIAGLVLLAIGFAAGDVVGYNQGQDSPKATAKVTKAPNPPTRAQLLKLVNAERAKYGVAPLKEDPMLDKSAQWKADDMAKYNYFGHVKPGTTGNDGLDYLDSLHPPCSYIDENLARWNHGPQTSKAVVNGWVHSKPHFKAMVNAKYKLTGFGIAGSNDKYVVEHFCQP